MDFELYSYGSAGMLRMIFNAIAMIFGNNDFWGALRIVALIGAVTVFIKSAFDQKLLGNFNYLMGMVAFIAVVLVPKSNLIITDRINPAESAVVSNVPIGLAATASFFSFTGDYLSRSFETVFSVPSELRYTETGLLFAQKLLDNSRKIKIIDARTTENFNEFFASCVVVDGIGHDRFTWKEVMESENLSSFFSTKVAINAASFSYKKASGGDSILPCRSGYTDKLKVDIESDYESMIKYGVSGGLIGRFKSKEAAAEKFEDNLQGAVNYLTSSSKSAQETVVQAGIINAMSNGVNRLSQMTNAAEFNDYIITGAEIERLSTYQALGDIASEKLPLLRSLFEAIIYAIFPLVIMMAILSPVKASTSYITALVWINLWGPTYAILHFLVSYHASIGMKEIADIYGGAGSVISSSRLISYNTDAVATAGYLATSLPMLTWMLVSRSGAMASSITGRMMQGYDSSVGSGSSDITKGSGERLGVEFKQSNNGSVQNTETLESGSKLTTSGSGAQYLDQKSSNLVVNASGLEQQTEQQQQQYEQSAQNTNNLQAELSSSNSAVLSSASGVMQELKETNSGSDGYRAAETAQQQQNFQEISSSAESWAAENGVKDTEGFKASLDAYAGGRISAGAGIPSVVQSLLGAEASASVDAGLGVKASGEKSNLSEESIKNLENYLESEQFAESLSHISQGTATFAAEHGLSQTDGSVQKLEASTSEQIAAKEAYTQSSSQTEQAKIAASQSQQIQDALAVNKGQALYESLSKDNNGDIEAVETLLRNAASGDQTAMEEIRHSLSTTAFTGQASNPEDSLKTMDALREGGVSMKTNDQVRDQGLTMVQAHGDAADHKVNSAENTNDQVVSSETTLTKESVSDYIDENRSNAENQFHTPNSVESNLGHVIDSKFDGMTSANESFVGAVEKEVHTTEIIKESGIEDVESLDSADEMISFIENKMDN